MTFLFLASAKYQGFKTGYFFATWRKKKPFFYPFPAKQQCHDAKGTVLAVEYLSLTGVTLNLRPLYKGLTWSLLNNTSK